MMDFLKPVVVAATVLSASVAQAGGPVIIEEGQGEEIAARPASSVGILPILGALVLICLVACGGGDDDPAPTPTPPVDPK
ncbi:hypothetical protein [Tabrizicola sp.]|uniref:hypothetical protein n=1 Tax=Tabrizicola sp. TaxID=2005166 RepID=UPI002FDE413D